MFRKYSLTKINLKLKIISFENVVQYNVFYKGTSKHSSSHCQTWSPLHLLEPVIIIKIKLISSFEEQLQSLWLSMVLEQLCGMALNLNWVAISITSLFIKGIICKSTVTYLQYMISGRVAFICIHCINCSKNT